MNIFWQFIAAVTSVSLYTIHQKLKNVYGDVCNLLKSIVYEWFKRFKNGRESLEDDDCSSLVVNIKEQRKC